jgi:hypothetical protein
MSKLIQRLVSLGVDLSTKKALKAALKILGIEPENIDKIYIELKNDIDRDDFKNIHASKKIVFLPQCLRNSVKCKAKLGEFGYECIDCCNCKASQVKKEAESIGYKVFIVPGGSMVKKIIEKNRPHAVAGVACMNELAMALDEFRIPTQSIELSKDGCVDTDVELEKVINILKKADSS